METQSAEAVQPHSRNGRFRPDVEGLRAIAVVLVLLYHAGVPGFTGGYIGVDVFFVISGFLITGLLLRELQGTGRLSLPNFYARRARRLLPAAVLTLVVILIGAVLLLPSTQVPRVAGDVASAAVYLSNMRFGFQANDYFAAESAVSPVLHFWSLSVEEQFYIIWPGVMLLLYRFSGGRTRGLFLGLGVLSALSLIGALVLTPVNQPWAFYLLPTRAWELGAGALIAIGVARLARAGASGPALVPARASVPLVIGGLFMIGLSAVWFTESSPFPGPAALLPVLGTCLVIIGGLTASPSLPSRWLGVAPMQFLGRTSYSIYLWHWPLLVFAAAIWGGTLPLGVSVLVALSAIPLAALTQRLVEDPLRYGKLIGTRVRLNLGQALASSAAVVLACVAVIGLVNLTTPATLASLQPPMNQMKPNKKAWCKEVTKVADYDACVHGAADGSRTMVLFGDSHARSWFAALNRLAKQNDWRLVSLARAACPSADVLSSSTTQTTWDPECQAWRERAVARIRDIEPELVVISNRTRPGYYIDGDWVDDPPAVLAEWERGMTATIEAIGDAAERVVIIGDVPAVEWDVPDCLAQHAGDFGACTVPTAAIPLAEYEVEAAVAEAMGGEFIDPTPWFCDGDGCPMVVDNTVVYRDGHHLTEPFSRSLAPELGAALGFDASG